MDNKRCRELAEQAYDMYAAVDEEGRVYELNEVPKGRGEIDVR